MKKQQLRKLNLKRETLVPLQSEQLDGVAGGATPTIVVASAVAITMFFCFPQQAR